MKEQLSVVSGQLSEDPSSNLKSQISNQEPLPASRKIYVETRDATVNHSQHNLRVPFREIALSPSKDFNGNLEENSPVRVYDTSGPWTDPEQRLDVRDGLPAHRLEWIIARGDVEETRVLGDAGTRGSGDAGTRGRGDAGTGGQSESEPGVVAIGEFHSRTTRKVLRGKPGACVTQMHYARNGIITPEMEYVAIRENLGRERERRHLLRRFPAARLRDNPTLHWTGPAERSS